MTPNPTPDQALEIFDNGQEAASHSSKRGSWYNFSWRLEEVEKIRAALTHAGKGVEVTATLDEIEDALEYAAMDYYKIEGAKPRVEQMHPFNFYAQYLSKNFKITRAAGEG